MIDLNALGEPEIQTEVEPSDNIFLELGKNTYDFKDLVSELIDNSLAAKREDRTLMISIDIYVDGSIRPTKFILRDDAKGIHQDLLGRAIAPAALQNAFSLNEHGLGMKQAIAALGKLLYLATKVQGEDKARVVRKFGFGKIPTFTSDFPTDSGTEIAVVDLNPIVISNSALMTRDFVPYLGARYRRFLKPDNEVAKIEINWRNETTDEIIYNWEVEEVKPIYFNPNLRSNKPVIKNHHISGDGWEAKLTFGYAPQPEEYEELGIKEPNKFHPYAVSLSKQGVDIIRYDRVILFHQLSEVKIINARHPDYNSIRGEIDLLSGFSTAITKNSIIEDKHFKECIDRVRDILTGKLGINEGAGKNYLKTKTYPDEIPEALLRDRLANWLKYNSYDKREDVKTEYVVDGLEGSIDILADGVAWELKTGQASGLNVYQLFMYMDIKSIDKGYLVAKDFTTGANIAAEHVKNHHKKEIILAKLEEFPILHHPDLIERDEYY